MLNPYQTVILLCIVNALHNCHCVPRRLSEREKGNWGGIALITTAIIVYFAAILWYAIGRNPANVSSFGGMWPGVLLLLLTLAYMVW